MINLDIRKDVLGKYNAEYNKRAYDEQALRELCFLPVTPDICNINVKWFCPYHYLLLDFIKSPFLKNGDITETDITQFLWIVSTAYKDNSPEEKKQFIAQIADLDFTESVNAIYEYLVEQYMDFPFRHEETKKPELRNGIFPVLPYYAWIVDYIDILASEYGWTVEYILHLPYLQLYQFVKAVTIRKLAVAGKEANLYNRYTEELERTIVREIAVKEKEVENG